MRYFLPLALFVVLAAFLWVGLGLNPRQVPSPFIDKPAPDFALPQLHEASRTVKRDDMLGKVWVLNVWASWCAGCLDEHPLLLNLPTDGFELIGLNYKDGEGAAKAWLEKWGDPYTVSLADADGRVGLDWGVYGVPETFVVDRAGIVRYKHIGPLMPHNVEETLVPLLRRLVAEK